MRNQARIALVTAVIWIGGGCAAESSSSSPSSETPSRSNQRTTNIVVESQTPPPTEAEVRAATTSLQLEPRSIEIGERLTPGVTPRTAAGVGALSPVPDARAHLLLDAPAEFAVALTQIPLEVPIFHLEPTPEQPFIAPEGLPKNTRKVPEGYWIGARPALPEEIQVLHNAGVRLVISGVRVDRKTRKMIEDLGMKHLRIPFGMKFPRPAQIIEAAQAFESDQIFVHCEHGGDRSGALLAFLLTIRDGWRPDHALLAMTYPGKRDVAGQLEVLKEAGLLVTKDELKTFLGIYSGDQNGGVGGLKVRNEIYRTLVRTTLKAMAASGIGLKEG